MGCNNGGRIDNNNPLCLNRFFFFFVYPDGRQSKGGFRCLNPRYFWAVNSCRYCQAMTDVYFSFSRLNPF